MKPLSFLNPDPQEASPQYLEDLATAYWFSEALFTAVEMGIFTFLDPMGKTIAEIARALESDCQGVERFLQALCAIGLLQRDGPFFFNTKIASAYLVKGKKDYQGEAILWRKYLSSPWRDLKECIKAGRRVTFPPAQEEPEQLIYRIRRFIRAMDCVARTKVREIIPIFEGLGLEGEILDVGAGSGAVAAAFLERFPSMRATLMDLPEVLDYAEELMRERGLTGRVTYCQANILEAWPVSKGCYDLVILSNLIHTYAENEVTHILARAAECLKADGFLVIHDFFPEHYPEKAALFDLNMLINTYNGKVFAPKWIREQLENQNLYVTDLIPLATDTALIIGSKNEKKLEKLVGEYV